VRRLGRQGIKTPRAAHGFESLVVSRLRRFSVSIECDSYRLFTHIGVVGPVRSGQLPDSIGVHEALDQPMPIGIANSVGRDAAALALWRLTIRKVKLPGRWIINDREFRTVQG
jgi:hypothetical protein